MTNIKVLAVYYSQSGQLGEIVESFTRPFEFNGIQVETIRVIPETDFPFPWTTDKFFDAMPESVLAKPQSLRSFTLNHNQYDLIIFAYQPWYLSLSIPSLSAIQHPQIQKILKGAPVVTLIGSRNMWLNAQEQVKSILKDSGAHLVGNVACTDRHGNLVSAVTILYWMLTGNKKRWLRIFPKPGVSDEDINTVSNFGNAVLHRLKIKQWEGLQQELVERGAVEVNPNLMFIEQRAPRLFRLWANWIVSRRNRKLWICIFQYYLVIALFIVAPIVLVANALFFRPFSIERIKEKIKYYQGVN